MTAFTITTDTLGSERVGSAADISDALARLDAGEAQFVILAKGPEDYLQTGPDAGGFTLERRDGSEETHRIAIHSAEAVANGSALSRAEIERAFLAYFRGVPLPTTIAWQVAELPETKPVYGIAFLAFVAIAISIIATFFILR